MFENEGNEIESTQSDVTPEASSEPQVESQTEPQAAAPVVKEPPFHEHPRWIERQNELNAERQARAQLEARVAEMQRQFQESQRPKNETPSLKDMSPKMRERLQGIDPEYASYMAAIEQEAMTAREELRQFREEQFVSRALSHLDGLNKSNNVTPEVAALYKAQIDQAYDQGKIRSLEDLEKVYKSVHEPISKLFEAREKAGIEKYTAEKKKTAAQPAAQPKGKAAAPGQGQKTFTNDQERRAAMIKEAVTQLRASKEV